MNAVKVKEKLAPVLSKYGQVMNIISLAINSALLASLIHERWVRHRKRGKSDFSLEDAVRHLLKTVRQKQAGQLSGFAQATHRQSNIPKGTIYTGSPVA